MLSIVNMRAANEGNYECYGQSPNMEPFYARGVLYKGEVQNSAE